MLVYIASDHEPTSGRIRQILSQQGLDCPVSNVVPFNLMTEHLNRFKPDLIVAVMGEDFERTLLALSGFQVKAPARVLAVGPASDSKLVIRALRAGADDYVDQDELELHLREALVRCRRGLPSQEEPGRLIAVLSPSGGSGSSTIAVNVATVLAKEHSQVALLDMKLEAGDLAALLDMKPTHTLADLCANLARMDRTLFERSLSRHASGIHLLAPNKQLSDIRHVTSEGVRKVLTMARSTFPYVIVDVDHSFRDEQAQVLRQADVILLVLRLDFAALRNARRTIDYLQSLEISKERVRLIINRHGQAREIPAAKAEEALGVKISHYIPDDPKTVNRANNNGVPLVTESPSAKISRSISLLAASVNGRHKTP